MSLAGPRLDRPSAVGDEGRPRATSMWIASALAVALAAVVAWAGWQVRIVVSLALPVGLVTAGTALLARDDFPAKFVGHLCFLPAASALAGVVPLVFVVSNYGFVALGVVSAFLGVSGTWADSANASSLRSALVQTVLAYVVMLVGMTLLLLGLGVGWTFWTVVTALTASERAANALVGLSLVVTVTGAGLRAALWGLPLRQLAPRERRPRVDRALGRVELGLTAGVALAFVATVALGALTLAGYLGRLFALAPPLGVLVRVVTLRPVVLGLLALGGAGAGLTVLAWVVRKLTQQFDEHTARNVGALAAGAVFTVGFPALVYAMLPVGGVVGFLLALVLTLFGPVLVLFVGAVGYGLVVLGVLPDRAGGPALAAAGLVCLTVGAGEIGLSAPYVLACAAGAMVVWDLSAFGLGVTAELGHVPETRRLELFHGVVAVGVGAVAVAALSALAYLSSWVAPGGAVPAATVAGLGAILLLWPLRG